MTKIVEKMVNVLTKTLSYCYCDNCKYSDYEEYGERHCDDCHRKYTNWALSPVTAEEIVKQIIDIYDKELIDKINQVGNINPITYDELKGALKNVE